MSKIVDFTAYRECNRTGMTKKTDDGVKGEVVFFTGVRREPILDVQERGAMQAKRRLAKKRKGV